MPHASLSFPTDPGETIPVLLDTDIGSNVDDLLAVLFALGSRNLELVAITTVYGDTLLRAKVARATLNLAGRSDVPVGQGRGEPLSGKEVYWTGHEGEGFDLTIVPDSYPSAASVYADALAEHGSNLVVVSVGPLTNVVDFFQDATQTKPRCVVTMAGRFAEGQPDRNVASDTVAAAQLTKLGVPVVFIGIELCRRVPYTAADLDALKAAQPGHPLTDVVIDRTQAWWDRRGEDSSNPCDALTLLALAHTELLEFQQADITIVPDGDQAGTVRWEASDTAAAWFATSVDVGHARRSILESMNRSLDAAPY